MIFRKKENKNKSVNESHLKNLMVLAMADGHLSEIEEHLLVAIAHRLGLNEKDVAAIKTDVENVKFILPEKYDDRIEQFSDLLILMAIDGHIDPEEEQVCRDFAMKYELMDQVIEEMLLKYR